MSNNEAQSSSTELTTQVSGVENPGAIASPPSAGQPDSAISTDKLVSTDIDYKASFSEQTHLYIRQYIKMADQKASFYFAFFSAVIVYSDTVGFLRKWVADIPTWGLLEVVSFLSMLLLVLAAFGCLWVVKPRLSGSKRGLVFFYAIAEFESQTEFFNEMTSASRAKLYEEKVRHTFDIAQVCSDKYQALGVSLWFGAIGFALLVVLMLFK
jgi:hypothetical protein